MSTATIHASANATLYYSVRVERTGGNANHRLITFPGMAGAEVLEGEDSYESFKVSGWIGGTKMNNIYDAAAMLDAQYRALRGRKEDTLSVGNDDGSTYTIKNIIGEAPPSYGQPARYSSGYIRPVTYVVRRVR